MEFQPGAVSLGDIVGGTLAVGTVPWDRLAKAVDYDRNVGIVAVGAVATEIVPLSMGDVAIGDIALVFGVCQMVKGAFAGQCMLGITKNGGTAGFYFDGWETYVGVNDRAVEIGGAWFASLAGIIRVATAGSLELHLYGASAGSDAAVAAQNASIYCIVLPTG